MLTYDPSAPLISLHVPKTGGTSLTEVLVTWFTYDRLRFHYREAGGPPTRHALAGGICIHGHFNGARGMGAWEYYPQARQYLMFLRDPFDRFLSQWFYLNLRKRQGELDPGLADDPSFEVWFHRRAEEQQAGRNSHSIVWHMPVPPGTADLGTVMDERFIFIGIMERYATSLEALARILGQPPIVLPHVNRAERDSDLSHWRAAYEKRFADEYELYTLAAARNADWTARVLNR